MAWNEDSAISKSLFKYAESYEYIQKYGIFHYKWKSTSSKISGFDLRKYEEIFFIDIVFDFSHNNFRGKKYFVEIVHKFIFPHIKLSYISHEDKKEMKSNFEKIEL